MNMLFVDMKIAGKKTITKTLNIVLPLTGIALMLVYDYCYSSCSYLKGTFMGIDLKWVGVVYMSILFASTFSLRGSWAQMASHSRTILISAAVGVEFFLIGWQIVKNIYCPFCLAFSVCVFILFGINFTSMNRMLAVASIIAAFLGFALFFEGQARPSYDLALHKTKMLSGSPDDRNRRIIGLPAHLNSVFRRFL